MISSYYKENKQRRRTKTTLASLGRLGRQETPFGIGGERSGGLTQQNQRTAYMKLTSEQRASKLVRLESPPAPIANFLLAQERDLGSAFKR